MAATRCGFLGKFVLLAMLAVASCRQITVYDDHHGDGPRSTHDYSDFVGDDSPISDSEDDAKASSGFAQPLDFSSFFSTGFGAAGAAGGGESNFFQPASSEVKPFTLPLSAAGSPFQDQLQGSATNNNGTGFTSPSVRFQSFFDATGSEAGFRAQDFLGKAENRAPDGEASANAPADFFIGTGFGLDDEGHSDGFGYSPDSNQDDRSSEYRSLVKNPAGPKSSKQAVNNPGKSSYPSVRGQSGPARPAQKYPTSYRPSDASQGAQKTPSFSQYKPSEPSRGTPYSAYPSKSTASYNPSGPYLSKQAYRPNDKPAPSRTYPSYGHEAKSGYPKKATEFYPTKVGTRYTAAATNQEYSSPNYDTARAFDAEHYIPDASSPYTPSEYGKDLESYQVAPQAEGLVEEVKITVSADNKNCRKIEKKLAKDNTMTCYVCEDPKTGGNIERCSYESDPSAKSQSYFHGHADSYSSDKGKTPTSYRYRRGLPGRYSDFDSYSGDKGRFARLRKADDGDNYRTNYDDYIAKFSEPSDSQYRYVPERYTQEADTEYQPPAQDTANNKDCKTVVKGTMTCSVCQNPKTGGSSEQCSYATNPDDNNYFVARQSSFNTKNKPYRKEISSQRSTQPKSSEGDDKSSAPSSKVPYETSTESAYIVTRKASHKGPLEITEHDVSDREAPSQGSDRRSDANVKEKNYDDYFKELFPEVVAARRAESLKAAGRDEADDDTDRYTGSASDAYNVDRSVDEFDDSHRRNNGPKSLSYRPSIGSIEDFGSSDKDSSKGYRSRSSFPEPPKKRNSPPKVPVYGNKPVADFDEYNQEYVQQSPSSRGNGRTTPRTHEALRSNARSDTEGDVEGYYKSSLPDYFADTEPKRDLEQVLGEFSQKDRSACKKVIRDKMTCYQCVDKQGMQHEECMFVAASEPKSQHLAYHEVKEFRIQPGSTQEPGKTDSDSDQTRTTDIQKPASTFNVKPIVVADSTGSQTSDVSKTAPEVAAREPQAQAKRVVAQRNPEARRTRLVNVVKETNVTKPTVESKRKAFFKKATTTTTVKPEAKRVVRVFKRPVKANSDGVTAATEGKVIATVPADKSETVKVGRKILGLAESVDGGEDQEKVRLSGKERRARRRGKKERQAAERARLEEEQESITEFFVHPDDLYPAKTERLYDPVLKVSLPAFMVERSEHEEIFDEVLAAGI